MEKPHAELKLNEKEIATLHAYRQGELAIEGALTNIRQVSMGFLRKLFIDKGITFDHPSKSQHRLDLDFTTNTVKLFKTPVIVTASKMPK